MEQFQKLTQEKQKSKNSITTHIFCSSCGTVLKQEDIFCPNCGTPRNTKNAAFAFATEEKKAGKKEPVSLSKEAAEQILRNYETEIQNPILQTVYNKFEQHGLMLNEKKLHEKTQERITSHFNFINDRQFYNSEFEYLTKITQTLRTSTIKQNIDFSKFSIIIHEKESQINELMEQRNKEARLLIKLHQKAVSSELAAIEAEKKRRELEELQRKIEIAQERKRQEKEKVLRGFAGSYSNAHNCPCGGYLHEKIIINIEYSNGILSGTKVYKWSPNCGFKDGLYAGTIYTATLKVELDGNRLHITETGFGFIQNPHNLTPADFKHNFEGSISPDGTLLKGYWFDDSGNSDGYFDYFKFK